MNCTKAIIPMAGFGTRRLPITKAVDKCMLPVGNRPIIDYVVEDCIKAGLTDIIFVVGEQFNQLQTYYGRNLLLEEYLKGKGKQTQLDEIITLAEKANFHYIVQDQHQPYGTTVPLWLCRDMIEENETFLFVSGDQFYFRSNGESEAAHLLQQVEKYNVAAAMKVVEVPHEDVYKYGIVKSHTQGEVQLLEGIVEKPAVEDAPSNWNNATFYLLNDKIFPYAEKDMSHSREGEYYVTDVVTAYAQAGNDVAVVKTQGEYMDCGTVEGWLHANNVVLAGK